MPIVAKSVILARKAAAADRLRDLQAATAGARTEVGEPVRRPSSPRRGTAVKNEKGKWQPTGNYETGFCRPPENTRFKRGGAPGPGRPKGSKSHDTLLKEQLGQKRRVRIGGRERDVAVRELVIMATVKDAAEGKDRHARKYVLDQMARIYPPTDSEAPSSAIDLTESDALSLAEFEADLRSRIRDEMQDNDNREGGL